MNVLKQVFYEHLGIWIMLVITFIALRWMWNALRENRAYVLTSMTCKKSLIWWAHQCSPGESTNWTLGGKRLCSCVESLTWASWWCGVNSMPSSCIFMRILGTWQKLLQQTNGLAQELLRKDKKSKKMEGKIKREDRTFGWREIFY